MAINCRVVKDKDGFVDYIVTEKGTRSTLFDDLVKISDKNTALNIYSLTETDKFKSLYPNKTAEPSVQQAVSFATYKDSRLTPQQKIDVAQTIMGAGLTSYGELLNTLKKIYIRNGISVFDKVSMEKSGFYTKYEIDSILSDISLQNKIRETISGLVNNDNETIPEYNPLFVISETNGLNSLGKLNLTNPFIVEKNITDQIAGTNIEQSIDSISYEPIKNAYYKNKTAKDTIDRIANKNKVLKQKQIVDGQLVDKTENNIEEILNEVLDLGNRQKILDKINFITNISPNVWVSSADAVYTVLKDLNKEVINAGVDFLDIQDKAFTKSRKQIIDLLITFEVLLDQPTNENLKNFTFQYSEFFEVSNESINKAVETINSNNIYLDTDLTEYQIFTEHGLIKQGNRIYQPVQVLENIEDIYRIVVANKQLLPEGISNESDLRDYVEQQMDKIDLPDFDVDVEQLQKLILYKTYFRSPIFVEKKLDNTIKYKQFTGDYSYLTEEYPSDFYKELLKEKRNNSDIYNNFYKYFTITNKGIELVYNDPITVQNIMQYVSEELKQYNLLSKNLGLPIDNTTEEKVDFNEMIYNRQQAISNPNSVNKLKKDYTVLSPVTIAVKNENINFVRTPAGVFEIDYSIGNVTFYNLLPKGNPNYNSFGLYKSKTQSDLNLDDYSYLQDTPEIFVKAKNYYSKSELKKIDDQYFGCL